MGRLPSVSPTNAIPITRISANFVPRITERLLKRSAKYPPAGEKRTNGAAKRIPATAFSNSRLDPSSARWATKEITIQR